ncbi:(2Fe-2S)-binding protein [Paenibacillus qinlingensis]|uniref:(2Fe-2S)-binding protein n=1 Tax=Paenibacillus qinlingensis TaxID=1837343 RepID=UPI0015677C25|nr:(2Fe-2S)-binding protein [Paenibacillus qinlingensis]
MDDLTSSLRKYFVTTLRDYEKSSYSYSVMSLLEEDSIAHILSVQSAQLGNPKRIVIGTLFAKRYSVFLMGLLAAASLHDTLISAYPKHVRFRITQGGAMAYETEIMKGYSLPACPVLERDLQFSEYVQLLQTHTAPLFQSVALHTGTNIKVMWALVSHNLQQLYIRLESDQKHWQTEHRLKLIRRDRVLLFEPLHGNLLAVKLRVFKHPDWHGPDFYLRPYCCLAYQIDSSAETRDYCTTCPKLDSEERMHLLNSSDNPQ